MEKNVGPQEYSPLLNEFYSRDDDYDKNIKEFRQVSENYIQQEYGSQPQSEFNEYQKEIKEEPKKSKFKKMMQYFVAGVAGVTIISHSANIEMNAFTKYSYDKVEFDGVTESETSTGDGVYCVGYISDIVKIDLGGYRDEFGGYDEKGTYHYYMRSYDYNESGYITESTQYDYSNHNICGYGKYEYDKQKRPIRSLYYSSDGILLEWVEFEYDGAVNNVTKAILYNEKGDVEYVGKYEYDNRDRLIKGTYFKSDGTRYFWYQLDYK